MPFDVKCLAAVREELQEQIIGMKIEKIQQPSRDMLILTLRGKPSRSHRLLISAGSGDTRVHLTTHNFENPQAPPMFCMLLRKHLSGAKITGITQPPAERILEITFLTSNAIGMESEKRLLLEMFGRTPNIVLIDSEGIIIDCLRRIGGELSGKRLVLPGLYYHAPAPASGMSMSRGRGFDTQSVDHNREKSISEELDELYTRKAQIERMRNRCASTMRSMKTSRDRLIRKVAAQKAELLETDKRESLRQCGDIITTNMHKIKKGQRVLISEDYYSESNAVRKIELDPLKTPQQNAAKYYKAYTKAKNAEIHLTEQIKKGEAELEYIESVIEQLSRVESMPELDEIRNELTSTGFINSRDTRHDKNRISGSGNKRIAGHGQRQKKASKQVESLPKEFISTSGMRIMAGKNNTQNDRLTFKIASRNDIWLHAQKIHGAHVVIITGGIAPDDTTLYEASAIAAYYSAARDAGKAPVDHTQVKNVKKLPGGRPGMVTYTDFKTLIAAPDEELVRRLLQ